MITLKKDGSHTVMVLDYNGVDKGSFSAPPHIIDDFMRMQDDARKYQNFVTKGLLNPLRAVDALYAQTVADPNADDPYLRGYTNGIRLMHATLHGREPDFIEEPDKTAKGGPEELSHERGYAKIGGKWFELRATTVEEDRAPKDPTPDIVPERVERSVARTYMELKEDMAPDMQGWEALPHTDRDRPVVEFYLDDLKKLAVTPFERRLLCILDTLVKHRS